jgi:hypothetical protein
LASNRVPARLPLRCGPALLLALSFGILSCRAPTLNPTTDDDLPGSGPRAGAESAERKATDAAVPKPLPDPICWMDGCMPGVSFAVHLDDPPATVGRRGAFHVCHGDKCWDGTFVPPRPSMPAGWACKAPRGVLMCALSEEGSGSKLDLFLGDLPLATRRGGAERVMLRVSVGGRTVVEQTRAVVFEAYSPDGGHCRDTCESAAVEIWPGSKSGVTCPNVVCDPTVRFEAMLPVTREGAGTAIVTACKNRDCKSIEAPVFWRWDVFADRPLPLSDGEINVVSVDGSIASVVLRSTPDPAVDRVEVTFRGDARRYRAGDVYRIEWKSRDGWVLLSEERVVTAYDETYPGGPECSPVACKAKVFPSERPENRFENR